MSENPQHFLNKEGKTLEIYLKPDTYCGKWINNNLTLFFDLDTNEFMGCEIYLGKDYDKVAEALGEE